MGKGKVKTVFVTGVVSFIYWVVPVIQFSSFDSYSDKINDYYVFFISSFVYRFVLMFETSPTPILVQLVFFLLTWLILYKLVLFFVKRKLPADSSL